MKTFLLNIFPDVLILILPLIVLVWLKKEENISPLWSFGVALLGIWGAYIDMSSLHYIQKYEYNNPPLALFIEIVAPSAVFLSYFLVVHVVMKQKPMSGIFVAVVAVAYNVYAWIFLKVIYGHLALVFCGISVLTVALVFYFMLQSWVKIRLDYAEAVYRGKTSPDYAFAIGNRLFAIYIFIQLLFLLIWPFVLSAM